LTVDRSLVLVLLDEYQTLCATGGFDPAMLFRLGYLAGDIADQSAGSHRTVAYVLRSVFFDFANWIEGDLSMTPDQVGSAFSVLDAPVRTAISSLIKPLDATRTMVAIGHLLDARKLSLDHLGYVRD
jgi:hypothetical protein